MTAPTYTLTLSVLYYHQLKEYISKDLLAMIYAAGDQNEMMEESQEAAMRREEMIRMYHTCNDALGLIRDVSSKTVHTPLPPPVQYDESDSHHPPPPVRGRQNPPPPSRPSRPTSTAAPPRPTPARSPVPRQLTLTNRPFHGNHNNISSHDNYLFFNSVIVVPRPNKVEGHALPHPHHGHLYHRDLIRRPHLPRYVWCVYYLNQ